jgi:hypothetical protein
MSPSSSPRRAVLHCEQLEKRLALDATSFVKSLYTNLLHRNGDTAGIAFWVGQIQNNGLSNEQVATDFWQSAEHRTLEVDAYYINFLHRTPDAAGLNFWVNEMLSGAFNEQGVEVAFLSSGEYIAAHNTPSVYVQGLYLDLLNRFPSNGETAGWLNVLANNGPAAVAAGIVTSPERFVDVIANDYQTYLNRNPDSSGLDFWLSRLETNQATVESVAEGIIGSSEYAATH